MQNAADEFNAIVWRERFLDELKAKNALTVESPDGDAGKCSCLLEGAPTSRFAGTPFNGYSVMLDNAISPSVFRCFLTLFP
uniref:Uncharacterized protein n=1 Tax=Globodera pallida TaxID=36090 RepID=A0A183C4H0_GLOPA